MGELSNSARSSKGMFAVALVFALGVVFGAALSVVLLRLHGDFPRPVGSFGRHSVGLHGGRGPLGRLARDLKLDRDQQTKIEAILERTHGAIQESLEETHREIRAILRPDQQARFDRMRPARLPFLRGGAPPPDEAPPPHP